MVNNVIRVVNYVIAAPPSLLNFMIADTRRARLAPHREEVGASRAGCGMAGALTKERVSRPTDSGYAVI
jgi:hypothetical protein